MRASLLLLVGASLAAHASAPAAKPKVAVPEIRVTGAVDPRVVAGLSGLIASEAARQPVQVISSADVASLHPEDKMSTRRRAGWIVGGAGLALIGTGVVFGVLAQASHNQAVALAQRPDVAS
ncbi:MAG: hypothetical protein AB1938_24040 [Myxococcota bacterium]